MIIALSRFISNIAFKSLPVFKLLKKEFKFVWTSKREEALTQLKSALSEPPILTRPILGEVLYLYLSISDEALGAVLVRESGGGQSLVYFVSKELRGPEVRNQKIEKDLFGFCHCDTSSLTLLCSSLGCGSDKSSNLSNFTSARSDWKNDQVGSGTV